MINKIINFILNAIIFLGASLWHALYKWYSKDILRGNITLFVLLAHTFLLFGNFSFNSEKPLNITQAKPITVNTVIFEKEKPKPKPKEIKRKPKIQTKKPLKNEVKEKPKKKIVKKEPSPKKKDNDKLLKELTLLSKAIEKIDFNEENEPEPKKKNETKAPAVKSSQNRKAENYHRNLMRSLQQNLLLPEYGSVKVQITVSNTGKIIDIKVLSHQSEENKTYLMKSLPSLLLPSFGDSFPGSKQESFIITLTSDI
jgi:hypothetical protein